MNHNNAPKAEPEKPKEEIKIYRAKRVKHALVDWLMMSTDEVLAEFGNLPNAQTVGEGDERFVYIPGTREDRMLLVAHADTVWHDQKIELGFTTDQRLVSLTPGVGTGADDRGGIAMLWKLKDLGHSILVPNAEESGCRGSKFLMGNEKWRKELNTHRFAIEMDRMNGDDIACYDVASDDFKKWLEKSFHGYHTVHGSWTDVGVLCDPDKHNEACLCGCNISIGYYGQHGSGEYIKVPEWQRTLDLLRKVLSEKDLPRFENKVRPVYVPPKNNYFHPEYGGTRDVYTSVHSRKSHEGYNNNNKTYDLKDDDNIQMVAYGLLLCPHCDTIIDENEWKQNNHECVVCAKSFE